MIEGAMRHGTTMDVEANYTDSHGQSGIGFGITRLLCVKRGRGQKERWEGEGSQMVHLPPVNVMSLCSHCFVRRLPWVASSRHPAHA
ncbi:Tn3 family transposase [Streptomyces sp. ID05-39B]